MRLLSAAKANVKNTFEITFDFKCNFNIYPFEKQNDSNKRGVDNIAIVV